MGREELLSSIQNLLSVFKHKIKMANSNNELSLNVQSENSIGNILNEVCNYELKNTNLGEKNSKAIDLIDTVQQVAFQITATPTGDKVYRTIASFLDSAFASNITSLNIFILGSKGSYSQDRINEIIRTKLKQHGRVTDFHFDIKENILDLDDLYHLIANNVKLDKILSIKGIIDREFHSLNELLSTFENKRRELFISFSEEDLDTMIEVILAVAEEKIYIIHNSEKLNNNSSIPESISKFLRYADSKDVLKTNPGHCMVLITNNYRDKWGRFAKCPILEFCLKKQAIIFPYSLGSVDPELLKSLPFHQQIFAFTRKEITGMIEHLLTQIQINQPVEYKNFQKVLEMAETTATFRNIHTNRAHGFQIFEKIDLITEDKFYFICFHKNALQEASHSMIVESYPDILNTRRFNIILIKSEDQKDISKRKENFRRLFKPKNIWYIDEFVYDFCTSREFQDKLKEDKQLDKYFVMPYLTDEKDNMISQNELAAWLEKMGTPIMVLKGSGGIGKTTLAYEIERLYLNSKPNAKCIFIESSNIINTLREKKVSDFYSIYKLSYEEDDGKLSQDRFRINFDNGNILIIIDGIDEIIAKVNSFEVSRFLETVMDFTSDLRNGKIVITCRDFFWHASKEDAETISAIDIKPFSATLAHEFFSKRHDSMPSVVNKCMRIANSFYGNNQNDQDIEFLPFVLDVVDNQVRYMIDREMQLPDFGPQIFESEILNHKSDSDFILYNICNRERIKLNQENVDSQIQLFIQLALLSNKQFGANLTIKELYAYFNQHFSFVTSEFFNIFLGHPILSVANDIVYFKYDFFTEYFKNIYVSEFIKGKHKQVSEDLVTILANYAKFSSNFSVEISHRLELLDDKYLANIIDLMEQMHADHTGHKLYRKAVCGLFMLVLRIKYGKEIPRQETSTELMTDIFGKSLVKNLSLVDVYDSDNCPELLFDFSDLTIENAYVDNYDYFWKCRFTSATKFQESTMKNVSEQFFKTTTAIRENFDKSCHLSVEFSSLWREKTLELKASYRSAIKDLRQFLGIFRHHGHLRHRYQDIIESRYVGTTIRLKAMIAFCKEHGIIQQESGKDSLALSEKYALGVSKYLTEGTISPELNEVIGKLFLMVDRPK